MATVNILDASNHYYDNSLSGLTAVNTQDAIDEIKLTVEQGAVTSLTDLGINDGTSGQLLTTNGSGSFTFEDAPIALPNQTGHSGKLLTTNGTTASWLSLNITRSDTSSSVQPTANATFTVVDSITTNSRGQVTAINVKTVTMPSLAIYDVNDTLIANV